MTDHDGLYHRLFSHPEMVVELLRDFVDEPWIADLDLTGLERLNARFDGVDGERRDGDIVWRVPLHSGGEGYLLLLLEFQSTVDRWMALRVLVYAGLLWQHLVKEKRLSPDGLLPPVFPLVLYNGDLRWTATEDLASLISVPMGSGLESWQPSARYRVIDEGRLSAAALSAKTSLTALLFRLEQAPTPADTKAAVEDLIAWFRSHPEQEMLKVVFAGLAAQLIRQTKGPHGIGTVPEDLQEIQTMLATRGEQWKREWLQEGVQIGRMEGRQEGEAAFLLRQLERRFGVLPDSIRARVRSAGTDQLEAWGLLVLDAGSLADVLD